ncbi:MAG: hypothetical protein HZA01_08250 [Nitrospinae bacterium]|nr:hypothetical protein [Nitrospinota bacterium]
MMSFLKKIYKGWLYIADKIAYVQTRLILFVLYFLGIGVYGIFGVIFRTDLLDKKAKDAETFFKPKEHSERELARYERQF